MRLVSICILLNRLLSIMSVFIFKEFIYFIIGLVSKTFHSLLDVLRWHDQLDATTAVEELRRSLHLGLLGRNVGK